MVNLIAIIVFFIGITIVLFLSLTGKVHLGLLFLIPLFPLRNVIERLYQFPLGKDFIDIILIAMILGWIFRSISNKEKLFKSTPFNKLLFIMIIFTYISLWRGSFYLGFPAPVNFSDLRLHTWKNYMIFPILFFITVNNIKNIKQIKWIILFIAVSMLLVDYYTLNQIRWMSSIASRNKIHGTFVFLGPNELSAFFTAYGFLLLGILLYDRVKVRKLLFAIVILLSIYCVLFLFSRGAYLSVLVGMLFLSLIKNKKFIIPILFLLLFWQIVLPARITERIEQTRTEEGVFDPAVESRLEMWQKGIEIFKENPIMGAGFNIFPYLGYNLADTHNIYIKTLAEQGLIGIIIILLLFYVSFKSGWRLYRTANDNFLKGLGLGFILCIITLMTVNFFGDRWTHLQVGTYFWIFLGLVVRGNIIMQEKLQQGVFKKQA